MKQPILIVEDDPDSQALVSHVVEFLNIPHSVVADAETAIDTLMKSDESYQAIIIDLSLPGKDGWELLAEIRDNPITANSTCIAVTGFHSSKIREDALNAGFNAYFPKPLDATQFAEDLNSLL